MSKNRSLHAPSSVAFRGAARIAKTSSIPRHYTSNGQPVVLPGADPHQSQALAGFFVVRANSYEQAIDLARTCPHVKYGSGIAIHKIDRLDTPDARGRDEPDPNTQEGES